VRNRLAILVGKGNPEGVAGLKDLANVVYVLCAVGVPCGTYGEQALTKAGVDVNADPPKSREANVKGVVTRVTTGEADAGIVYVTDAKASAKNADTVDIPDEHNVTASYPMAALKDAPNPAGAAAFMAFLLSSTGQEILVSFGFLPAA
jgi:molybdate transport system substrate-binding protein